MGSLQTLFCSSVGRKAVVGITGIFLILFVLGHLSGNLLVFAGRDAFNTYAQSLHDLGPLLWLVRAALLGAFILHVWFAVCLARQNCHARPNAYVKKVYVWATYPSRMMLISGGVLFTFILYHLAHFTIRIVHYTGAHFEPSGRRDVFEMLVLGFREPYIVGLYIVAMLFLSLHLCHAVPSVLQTFGMNHPKYNGAIRVSGPLLATLVFIGYVSIPVAVLLGVVG